MLVNTEEIRIIIERQHRYPLLFSTITGSHSFDIASPLSDYDVHGAHLLSLRHQLGFDSERDVTIEIKAHLHDETEVDISTHDLKKLLLLMIKSNGNALEDVYSPLIIHTSPLHEESQLPDKTPTSVRQALEDILIRARIESAKTGLLL